MPSWVHLTDLDKLGTGTCSAEAGSITEFYRLEPDPDDLTPVTQALLTRQLLEIVGFTNSYGDSVTTTPVNGRLARTIPLAHNFIEGMFASRVTWYPVPYRYTGYQNVQNQVDPNNPKSPQYGFWGAWEFRVEFSPRPYAIVNDFQILPQGPVTWWQDDGTQVSDVVYYPEWLRYCEGEVKNRPNDVVTWKGGKNVFRTGGALADSPVNLEYPGHPYFRLPTFDYTLHWYCVPYRYIKSRNSYITNYVNHVNQLEFRCDDGVFAPGEMLYHSWSYDKYQHPFAPLDPAYEDMLGAGDIIQTPQKLVNIHLHFLVTRATTKDALGAASIANPNWIVGGHNLLPYHKTRQFYYAASVDANNPDDNTSWHPLYNSFPMQLLFKDPDVALGV